MARTLQRVHIAAVLSTLGTLTAAEPVVLHLRQDQSCPADAAGTWTRLADGFALGMVDGDALIDLPVGAYTRGELRIALRSSDDAAGRALSLVGARAQHYDDAGLRGRAAESLEAFDTFSLIIAAWRLDDQQSWPWVGHGLTGGGLLGLCTVRIGEDDVAYDSVAGGYTVHGDVIRIAADAVQPGDCIVARPAHALLVADLGTLGVLDPADEVVLALPDADQRVRRIALGDVVGRGGFTVWRRDPTRIRDEEGPHQRAHPSPHHLHQRADELRKLPLHKQWLAALGMALICGVLLRLYMKRRRR